MYVRPESQRQNEFPLVVFLKDQCKIAFASELRSASWFSKLIVFDDAAVFFGTDRGMLEMNLGKALVAKAQHAIF